MKQNGNRKINGFTSGGFLGATVSVVRFLGIVAVAAYALYFGDVSIGASTILALGLY